MAAIVQPYLSGLVLGSPALEPQVSLPIGRASELSYCYCIFLSIGTHRESQEQLYLNQRLPCVTLYKILWLPLFLMKVNKIPLSS